MKNIESCPSVLGLVEQGSQKVFVKREPGLSGFVFSAAGPESLDLATRLAVVQTQGSRVPGDRILWGKVQELVRKAL